MICTELCHRLVTPSPNDLAADAYFTHFAARFYYPSPIFEGYTHRGNQTFPVSAILKFLLAKARAGQPSVITVDEVVDILVANHCTGDEPLSHYGKLQPKSYSPATDEVRQVREVVRFISQMSFLKWVQPHLYLDVDPADREALANVETLAQPIRRDRNPDSSRELLELGRTGDLGVVPVIAIPAAESDLIFSEGKPKRVSHLRYERSPRLRQIYFSGKRPPFNCDMCDLNVSRRYPWADNLLELHHLLPLASPLRVEERRTSLAELAAICPSCHKATHLYYRQWLDDHEQDDFVNYDEVHKIYRLAKESIVIANCA